MVCDTTMNDGQRKSCQNNAPKMGKVATYPVAIFPKTTQCERIGNKYIKTVITYFHLKKKKATYLTYLVLNTAK